MMRRRHCCEVFGGCVIGVAISDSANGLAAGDRRGSLGGKKAKRIEKRENRWSERQKKA